MFISKITINNKKIGKHLTPGGHQFYKPAIKALIGKLHV